MISESDLNKIQPKTARNVSSSSHVQSGVPVPKSVRIRHFSPDEWEEFIEEWASSLDSSYVKVRRFGGAGDLGVDISGFCSEQGFHGDWDNFQCKRYDHPLRPGDIWVEIGKVIYYSHQGQYQPPRRYYFVCSQGVGTSLEKLLDTPGTLKEKLLENWDKHCRNGITSTQAVPLAGALRDYFDAFNFSIFPQGRLSKSSKNTATPYSTQSASVAGFHRGLIRISPRTRPQRLKVVTYDRFLMLMAIILEQTWPTPVTLLHMSTSSVTTLGSANASTMQSP